MHEYAVQCYTLNGVLPEQTGHDLPTSTLYGVFRALDGDLVIAAQVDEAWKRFAVLLENHGAPAGFATDTRFHSVNGHNTHRNEILQVVKDWVAQRPVTEVLQLLESIDVPATKVQRIDEVIADPQIQARGMMVEQQHPRYGKLHLPNLPFHLSGGDTTIRQPAPDLDQHNQEVAASLGYSAQEIEQLQTEGVLFSPSK